MEPNIKKTINWMKKWPKTCPVVHWLRIPLPMQGTWVWSLLCEDSTCQGATKPMYHNYWAHTLQQLKPACPRAPALQQEKPPKWELLILQLESSHHSPQLEKSASTERKTQSSQKWRKKYYRALLIIQLVKILWHCCILCSMCVFFGQF